MKACLTDAIVFILLLMGTSKLAVSRKSRRKDYTRKRGFLFRSRNTTKHSYLQSRITAEKIIDYHPETVFGKPSSGCPKQGPLASFDFENQTFAFAEVCILNSILSWKFAGPRPHCGDGGQKMMAFLTDTISFIFLLMGDREFAVSQKSRHKNYTHKGGFLFCCWNP